MSKLLKLFLICLLGFAICIESGNTDGDPTAEWHEQIVNMAEKCRAIVGASADDVKDLLKKDPPKTNAAKCLHTCLMKELKLMDSAGKFVREAFVEYETIFFNGNKTLVDAKMKIYDVCSKIKSTNKECEDAIKFVACMEMETEKSFKLLQG